MENSTKPCVILAAGGTGGHIFPAEALAEELTARGILPLLVTDARFGSYANAFSGVEVATIASGQMGGGLKTKASNAWNVLKGAWQARGIIRKRKPIAVIGFGGYPSFPTMLAATAMNVHSAIHEQNAVLGRANRVLAGRVKLVATAYPHTRFLDSSVPVRNVGNPVRASIRALANKAYISPIDDAPFHLLVIGGSQGAKVFSDVVPEAIALLPEPLRTRLHVVQQARDAEKATVENAYRKLGVAAEISSFFADMPTLLEKTHLVITRAGASTVAELCVSGKPAILVPLPSAMDDHQSINAQSMEESGAAWVMKQEGFTPKALAARLESFLNLPAPLEKAAAASAKLGAAHAARELADALLESAPGGAPYTTAERNNV